MLNSVDQVNLNVLKTLQLAFQCKVGFSDHTLGTTAAICATSLGASVIEKHITLDKNMKGPDHIASLEPHEFKYMVEAIHESNKMLGSSIKAPQNAEKNTREVARRSIRAARNIKKGEMILEADLIYQRPGDGLSPMNYKKFVNGVASKDYQRGELILLT